MCAHRAAYHSLVAQHLLLLLVFRLRPLVASIIQHCYVVNSRRALRVQVLLSVNVINYNNTVTYTTCTSLHACGCIDSGCAVAPRSVCCIIMRQARTRTRAAKRCANESMICVRDARATLNGVHIYTCTIYVACTLAAHSQHSRSLHYM